MFFICRLINSELLNNFSNLFKENEKESGKLVFS